MTELAAAPPPTTLPELSARMADELARLDKELGEVDLLIAQATTEASRHEGRRVAGADKLAAATAAQNASGAVDPTVTADLNTQLVLLTKRAALMESQVEVLEGKRRALWPLPRIAGRLRRGLERVRRRPGDRPTRVGDEGRSDW